MRSLAFLFTLLVFNAAAWSQEWSADSITIDGRTYTKAVITKANAHEAKITHSDGIKRVPIAMLPAEAKSAIGYDQEAAQAAEATLREQAAANARRQQQLKKIAEAKEGRFIVRMNYEEGILAETMYQKTEHIGGGLNSVGGGGNNVSFKSWKPSGKYTFIPHTKQTKGLAVDSIITAKYTLTGTTKRINAANVHPVTEILVLIP